MAPPGTVSYIKYRLPPLPIKPMYDCIQSYKLADRHGDLLRL
jgi:hypothetical protein